MIKKALLAPILVLFIVAACGCGSPAASKSSFEKANEAFQKKDYEAALSYYLQVDPDDPNYSSAQARVVVISEAFYKAGLDYYENNDHATALHAFNLIPPETDFYEAAQPLLEELKEALVKEAITNANEALKQNNFAEARQVINNALVYVPDNEQLKALFNKTIAQERDYQAKLEEQKTQAYKDSCRTYEYRVLEKDADRMAGQKIYFVGQVVQIMENSGSTTMRVGVTKKSYGWSSNDIIYVYYPGRVTVYRDDIVYIWGEIDGLHTYTSVANYKITVPKVTAEYIYK